MKYYLTSTSKNGYVQLHTTTTSFKEAKNLLKDLANGELAEHRYSICSIGTSLETVMYEKKPSENFYRDYRD